MDSNKNLDQKTIAQYNKLELRYASNDVADSSYCKSCKCNTGENIGHYVCVKCGKNK